MSINQTEKRTATWMRAGRRWNYLTIMGTVIVLLISTVLIFLPLIIGKRTVYSGLDNIDQFYVWYQKLAVSFHAGDYAFWDPNVLGGKSLIGETQAGILYPLNILWITLFGSAQGISRFSLEMLVVLHGFIAICGMYWLVRQFRVRRVYALIAGITFAAFGPVIARAPAQVCIYYGLAWMPFAIGAFLRALLEKRHAILYGSLGGACTGLIILSGHLQPFIHLGMIITGLIVSLWALKQIDTKRVIQVAISFIIATLLVGGTQLMVSYRWLNESYRLFSDGYRSIDEKPSLKSYLKDFVVQPSDLSNYVEPGFLSENNSLYVGLLPLIVCITIFIVYASRKRKQEVNLFLGLNKKEKMSVYVLGGVGIFGFIISFGYRTWVASILYFIPFVGNSVRQVSRYSILPHIAAVLLFVLALQALLRMKPTVLQGTSKRKVMIGGVSLVLLLQALYYIILPNSVLSRFYRYQCALTCLALVVVLLSARWQKIYVRLMPFLALLVVLATAHFNVWIYSMPIKAQALPETIYVRNDVITYLESYYREGFRVLVLDNALPQNVGDVYDIATVTGYGATIYKPYLDFIESDKKSVGANVPFDSVYADSLGVRFVVSKKKLPLKLIMTEGDIKLYERQSYASKIQVIDQAQNKPVEAKFTIDIYKNVTQKYTVTMAEAGDIVLTEFAASGWQAFIDGKTIQINPYNTIKRDTSGPFMKIHIEKGTHELELHYRPFTL